MTLDGLISMIILIMISWGGFIFCLILAYRYEVKKNKLSKMADIGWSSNRVQKRDFLHGNGV